MEINFAGVLFITDLLQEQLLAEKLNAGFRRYLDAVDEVAAPVADEAFGLLDVVEERGDADSHVITGGDQVAQPVDGRGTRARDDTCARTRDEVEDDVLRLVLGVHRGLQVVAGIEVVLVHIKAYLADGT